MEIESEQKYVELEEEKRIRKIGTFFNNEIKKRERRRNMIVRRKK